MEAKRSAVAALVPEAAEADKDSEKTPSQTGSQRSKLKQVGTELGTVAKTG